MDCDTPTTLMDVLMVIAIMGTFTGSVALLMWLTGWLGTRSER